MEPPRITDKRTIAERYGNKTLMEKKPQKNTKYKSVTKVVDTGKTINDVQFISDQLVSKRKSELFKRVKGSTIVKLLNQNPQTESIYNLGNEPEQQGTGVDDNQSVASVKTSMTQQSSITAVTYATDMLGDLSEIDFLILDLREEDEYKRFHVKEAHSYPGTSISRDKFISQMIMMKNKESKMIIVYHTDERNGVPYAGLLFQKGYDNVYFLSGGIEEFCKKFPEYLEGPEKEKYVNMKIAREKNEEEEKLKKTGMKGANKGKSGTKTTTTTSNVGSSKGITNSQSAINNLKQNLAKK